MTRGRRVLNVITGLIILLVGIGFIIDPLGGLKIAAMILSLTFTFRGLGRLWYYFSMARYTVDGKIMLYIGMLYLEIGIFTSALRDNPQIYIILYLMIVQAFTGIVDILRGVEARRLKSPAWKYRITYGMTNLVISGVLLAAGLFGGDIRPAMYAYGAGLIYSACIHIGNAFRKQAIVYIQ